MMEVPAAIRILSDDTELEFVRIVKQKGKEDMICYRYTKSIESLGKEIMFTEMDLVKQLGNYFKEK